MLFGMDFFISKTMGEFLPVCFFLISNFIARWSENIVYGILIIRYLKLSWRFGHFSVNVLFVFEKNVYSVFLEYRRVL